MKVSNVDGVISRAQMNSNLAFKYSLSFQTDRLNILLNIKITVLFGKMMLISVD